MRQKILLLGAVFFGFLAFVLSYQQLETEKQRITGNAESVYLIKMNRDMAAGEEVAERDISRAEVQRLRNQSVSSREIPWSQSSSVIGRRLESSMSRNQYLQTTDLKPMSQRQGLNGIVRQGMRAISIPVDTVSAVNNLVQPNDNVDIIGTFRFPDMRGDTALDTVTLTVLQDVKVLAVGSRWGNLGSEAGGSKSYSTVTLLLWPDEVEMLVFASNKGKLALSLRNYEDSRIERGIESNSINFKQLEKDIPKFNERRSKRQNTL
ncbi:MAG: Flp pilus assembly protein CpaB [Victivallaceae bacterium]